MNAEQAKGLIGKSGLFQVGDEIVGSVVKEVSPSGKYVWMGWDWHAVDKVTFLEELPEQPKMVTATEVAQTAAVTTVAVPELTATKAALAEAQQQNTILNEQLGQARQEIATLKLALTAYRTTLAEGPGAVEGAKIADTATTTARLPEPQRLPEPVLRFPTQAG